MAKRKKKSKRVQPRQRATYAAMRQRMRLYRETLGLTIHDCVKDLEGINAERWKNIERGRVTPSLHDGIMLAARLGCTITDLIGSVC